jgi:multimeric flavodoxin WrbA
MKMSNNKFYIKTGTKIYFVLSIDEGEIGGEMKYCIIFGSPRKKGNTASLLSLVMEYLKKEKKDIKYFDVYEKNIKGCTACLGCQKDLENICCVIQDDMQEIYEAVEEADVIVIASPVYVRSAPAPVKAVIDRLVYAGCKYYGDDPFGPSLFQGKKLALITTCGYPLEKGVDLYEEAMKRYCKHTKMEYIGSLAERQRNLKEPFMDEEKRERATDFAKVLANLDSEQE